METHDEITLPVFKYESKLKEEKLSKSTFKIKKFESEAHRSLKIYEYRL
jgi:hypothetical protein